MRILYTLLLLLGVAATFYLTWMWLRPTKSSRMERTCAATSVSIVLPTLVASWLWLLHIGGFSVLLANGALVIAATVCARRSGDLRNQLTRLRSVRLPVGGWISLLVLLGLTGIQLYAALNKPYFSVDALLYHGGTSASLLAHNSWWGWSPVSLYSFYPDLLAAQSAEIFLGTGSTSAMDVVQAPYLLILGLVVWTWAGLGRPRWFAGTLSTLVLAMPAVYGQARTNYVDIAFAAVTLAGLWAFSRWLSDRTTNRWLLISMVLVGAAAVIKPSGAPVAVLMVGVTFLLAMNGRRFRDLLAGLIVVTIAATPVYLRNLIEKGNPFYPLEVSVPGIKFHGEMTVASLYGGLTPPELAGLGAPFGLMKNLFISAVDGPSVLNYDVRLGGFGYPIAALAVIAAAVLVLAIIRRPTIRLVTWLFPLVSMVLLVFIQPESWYPRYSITAAALLFVVVGVVASSIEAFDRLFATLGLASLLCALGLIWNYEQNMLGGLSQLSLWKLHRGYNQGVSGWNPAYDEAYAWVKNLPCGNTVYLSPGIEGKGAYGAYSFGLWGDNLCNNVVVGAAGSDPLSSTQSWDELVVDEADEQSVIERARHQDLCLVKVSDAPEIYGAKQAVLAKC